MFLGSYSLRCNKNWWPWLYQIFISVAEMMMDQGSLRHKSTVLHLHVLLYSVYLGTNSGRQIYRSTIYLPAWVCAQIYNATRMGVALNLVEDAHLVLRPPPAHITHYRTKYEAKTAGETNDDFIEKWWFSLNKPPHSYNARFLIEPVVSGFERD